MEQQQRDKNDYFNKGWKGVDENELAPKRKGFAAPGSEN